MAKAKLKTHVKVKLKSEGQNIREAVIPIQSSMLLTREERDPDNTTKIINREGPLHFEEEVQAIKLKYFAITLLSNTYWEIGKEEYERLIPILT